MPDPIITGDRPNPATLAPPPGGPLGSLAVTFDSLISAADSLRSVGADLAVYGDIVGAWQRPVGTDEVMGSGNADRSWRQLAERWGAELRFYGDDATRLSDALTQAAMGYRTVETEVSARCRG